MHKLLVNVKLCRVHILYFGELCCTDAKNFTFNLQLKRKKYGWLKNSRASVHFIYTQT